jgi:hypothetical protein
VFAQNSLPEVVAFVLVLATAASAEAADPITARAGAARIDVDKPAGPTPMVKRGLILPPKLLDIYAQPMIERPVGVDVLRFGPTVGALWGFMPELHADFQITPYYLPLGAPGTSRLAIIRRIVKTQPIDVGVGFMTLFDHSAPSFIVFVQPGAGVLLRPNDYLRIDTGVQVPLYTSADPHFGLRIPVSVYFQITDRIHVGSTSALFIADLRNSQATASIPLGLTFGYSAGPELDFAAFTPYISWTNFYAPGSGVVDRRSFVAGIIADVALPFP